MITLEHQIFSDNEYWTIVHTENGQRRILGELSAYCKKEGGGYSAPKA